MPYLNCRKCGLSVRSRNPLTDRAYCPRCRARGRVEPLLRAPLPLRRQQQAPTLRKADAPAHPMNDLARARVSQQTSRARRGD